MFTNLFQGKIPEEGFCLTSTANAGDTEGYCCQYLKKRGGSESFNYAIISRFYKIIFMLLLGAITLFCDSQGSASPNYMKIFTISLDDVILWLFHELEEILTVANPRFQPQRSGSKSMGRMPVQLESH